MTSLGEAVNFRIQQALASVADRYPTRTAVAQSNTCITYKSLWHEAISLGHKLRELRADSQSPIAILLEPGIQQIICICGILESGVAYVPLDPMLPVASRIDILRAVGCSILLTHDRYFSEQMWAAGLEWICSFEKPSHWRRNTIRKEMKPSGSDVEMLACIIPTSGSTANPKPIALSHDALLHHVHAFQKILAVSSNDTALLLSSPSFSLSLTPIFVTLLSGGTVAIPELVAPVDIQQLAFSVSRFNTTFIKVVPSLLRRLIALTEKHDGLFSTLRAVVISGEPVDADLIVRWKKCCSQSRVIITYGCTEAVSSTWREITDDIEERGQLHVGQPLDGVNIFIHNEDGACKPHEIGHIFVTGPNMFAGTFEKGELISPDLSKSPGGFDTHDLGYEDNFNNLRIVGRSDTCIKVSGYRVQLEDIERVITDIPGVHRAAVYQSSPLHLTCHLEFNSAVDLRPSDIQHCISFKLPKHMIPKEFYSVVCLPTLPSGKIDRQRLEGLKGSRLVDPDDRSAPIPSSLSAPLLAIWQAALHKNTTQLDISFYDLGGDSLQLIDMILKIEETTGISVAQSRFMQEPTLRNLLNNFVSSPAIENNIELNDITIRYSDLMSLEALAALDWKQSFEVHGASLHPPYALNVSQANALNDRSEFYFTYIHLQFSKGMDKAAFSRALTKLILRHEMLRTVLTPPALQNAIDLRAELVLPVVHREEQSLSVSASTAMGLFSRMPLRLDTWPLFRWTLLQKGDACQFIWQISHLVCDLFGVDVLTRELVRSYVELSVGNPNSAVIPALSNRDYAAEIGSCLHYDEHIMSHIESQLQGYHSAVESCKNHMRASGITDDGFMTEKTLPDPLITSDSYLLLANYCLAIADCFELESVPIRAGTPGRSYGALTSNYFPLVTKGNDHYLFVVEHARASDSRSLAAELKERFKWYRDHSINFDKIIRVLRTVGRLIGPMSSIFAFGPLGKITCVADTNAGVKSLPRALWGLDSFHLQGHNALKIGLFTFQERDSVFVHLYSRGIAAAQFSAFCSAFEQRLRPVGPTNSITRLRAL